LLGNIEGEVLDPLKIDFISHSLTFETGVEGVKILQTAFMAFRNEVG
jgi:hypothetical protein